MKQAFCNYRFRVLVILTAILTLAGSGNVLATEVHTWTDDNGIVHFSDAPSASGDSRLINIEGAYMPGTTGAYPAGENSQQAPAGEGGEESEDSPQSVAQQRREQLAKDRDEKKKAKAEADKMCGLHRQRLEQMEPARRVMFVDEQGEQVRMDDDQRMGLIDESKEFLASNCE
jgi:hypothetical protein